MSVEMSISSQLGKHPLTLTHPTGFTQTFRFTRDDRNFRPKGHDNYDDSSADLKAAALKKKELCWEIIKYTRTKIQKQINIESKHKAMDTQENR